MNDDLNESKYSISNFKTRCKTLLKKYEEEKEVQYVPSKPNNKSRSISSKSFVNEGFYSKEIMFKFYENISEKKENQLDLLYKGHENNVPKIILELTTVNECSIFKYGVKPSTEKIKHSYCITCDKNYIYPICEACIKQCHKGHRIKENFEKGKIICACGEKLHNLKSDDKKSINIKCIFTNWINVAKLNDKNEKSVCIICGLICENNSTRRTKDKSNIECKCTNIDIHNDIKKIIKIFLKIFKDVNKLKKLLHPTQIMNMFFKGKESFKYIFSDFNDCFNFNGKFINLNIKNISPFLKIAIDQTNIYLSFKLFKSIIIGSELHYYNSEIVKYFNFNILKLIINITQSSEYNEESYWKFFYAYILLFDKIYINSNTNFLYKLKIPDLENFSFLQRLLLTNNDNTKIKKETKSIISFMHKKIKVLENYKITSIETIKYIKNILNVMKKLASYNLISVDDMINICIIIELIFCMLSRFRNSLLNINGNIENIMDIELKLLNIIVKLILFFIYSYNDKMINELLLNKEKYPSVKFIDIDDINLLPKKNKLGNLINKLNIRVLSILNKFYAQKIGNDFYKKIIRNSIKIFEFSLFIEDNYMRSLIKSIKTLNNNELYNNFAELKNNKYYPLLIQETNKIEKAYNDYLNFFISIKTLEKIIDNSLDTVLEDLLKNQEIENNIDADNVFFIPEKNLALIKTQYFYKLSKLFNIYYFNEDIINNDILTKILNFYNIFISNSSDNSILLLSSNILKNFLNLPQKYNLNIFKLLFKCFANIYVYEGLIINFSYPIEKIYYYLLKSIINEINDENSKDQCLFYFLKIIKIIIYDIKIVYNTDIFIYDLKKIICGINQNFNLCNKYFDYKISETKNKKNQKSSIVFQDSSNYDLNILSENFLIYFKIINDIFNFSLSEDRNIINRLLNVDLIIYGLSNFILSFGERTEFIRFIRKMTIDVNYCENKEELYASFLINNKDNLSFIKSNELINNLKYPTKLFSFKKDFYNLSKYSVQKERNNFKMSKKVSDTIKKGSNLIIDTNVKDEKKNLKSHENYSFSFLNRNNSKDLSIIEESMISQNHEKSSPRSTDAQCKVNKTNFNNKDYKSKRQSFSYQNFAFLKDQIINNINNNRIIINNKIKGDISDYLLKFNPIKQSNKQENLLKFDISANENINIPNDLSKSKNFYTKDINNSKSPFQLIKSINEDIKANKNEQNEKILEEDEDYDNYQNFNDKNKNNDNTESYFDEEFYELLNNEVENFISCTTDLNFENQEFADELKYYFENGIILSIISFFERVFVYINLYTGNQIIKIYQLLEKCIRAKIQIFNFNYDFWHEKSEEKRENIRRRSFFKTYNTIKIDIDYNNKKTIFKIENPISFYYFIDAKSKRETFESLNYMKKKDFYIFDYTSLYKIVEKEFFILIKHRKSLNISELFKKNKRTRKSKFNDYSEDEDYYKQAINEIIIQEEKNVMDYDLKSDFEKKLIKIYLLYKYNKNSIYYKQSDFSLFSIFHESCLEFQDKYENLFLIYLTNNNILLNTRYYLLLRLLIIVPNEIQSCIIQIIGGTNATNKNFMILFSQKLFSNLILSFIDYLNPPDKIMGDNYFVTLNLIKIFKCLCEQYNKFFQHYLIKSLTYFYKNEIPEKYIYTKTIKPININNNNSNTSFEEEQLTLGNNNKKNKINYLKTNNYKFDLEKNEIHFHDFFLCVLIKLLLVSDRFFLKFELLNIKNSYIYDLFEAILEMLIIIIQGNKMEITNQEYYQNNEDFFLKKIKQKNEENSSSISSSEISKIQIDIGNPYEIFIESSIEILFGDKSDNNMIDEMYDIKYNLAVFFLCVLEENNFHEIIKRFLITNLNIKKIVSTIGEILKFYYINQEAKKEKEKENNIKNNEIKNFTNKKNIEIKKNLHSKNLTRKLLDYNANNDLRANSDFDTSSDLVLKKQIPPLVFKSKIGKKLIYNSIINRCCVIEGSKKNSVISLNMNYNRRESKKKKFYSKDDMKFIKKDLNKIIKTLYFDDKLLEYFEKIFYQCHDTESFIESHEFKLSNIYYKLIKTTSVRKQKKISIQLIRQTNKIFKRNNIINHSNLDIKEYIKDNYYNKQLDQEENSKSESPRMKKRHTFIKQFESINLKTNKKLNLSFTINKNKKKPAKLISKKEDTDIKEFTEQFYITKFFEDITSTIEIRTKEKERYISIFTKVPEYKYLSEDSKVNFLNNANRQSEKSKKNDLLRNIDYFIAEMQYYKNSKNMIIKWFSKRSFIHLNGVGYLIVVILNLFLLFTIKGDYQISKISNIKDRRKNKSIIDFLIKKSVNYWDKFYLYIVRGYIIKNLIIIVLIFYSRVSLYYKLDKLKYINHYRKKQKQKTIHIKDKIYIFFIMTIFRRDYIFCILYELVITIISIILDTKILYAFLLLTILNSIKTLKNVMMSILLKPNALVLVLFLSFIIIYVMSNISYFFYKTDYEQDISYHDDNVCENLIFCFLNALDYGLRARGGIGDSGKRISYLRDFNHYIGRFFLDVLYFILIVIIMIDMIFIIIAQSFISLKNEKNKTSLDKKSNCFICHVNVDILNKNFGQSLNEHRKMVHNVWNYVEYIIFLKKNDISKLNYFDTYVSKKIQKKDISWMPTFDDVIREINQKYEGENTDDLDVMDENINKYKLLRI